MLLQLWNCEVHNHLASHQVCAVLLWPPPEPGSMSSYARKAQLGFFVAKIRQSDLAHVCTHCKYATSAIQGIYPIETSTYNPYIHTVCRNKIPRDLMQRLPTSRCNWTTRHATSTAVWSKHESITKNIRHNFCIIASLCIASFTWSKLSQCNN